MPEILLKTEFCNKEKSRNLKILSEPELPYRVALLIQYSNRINPKSIVKFLRSKKLTIVFFVCFVVTKLVAALLLQVGYWKFEFDKGL
jgi:hypothetical protein